MTVKNSAVRRAARRLVALKNFKIMTKDQWLAARDKSLPMILTNEEVNKQYDEYVQRKEQERTALENKERRYVTK